MINTDKLVSKGGIIIIDDTHIEIINNYVNLYLDTKRYVEIKITETYVIPHRVIYKL